LDEKFLQLLSVYGVCGRVAYSKMLPAGTDYVFFKPIRLRVLPGIYFAP
jgi:hypothetical protein